METVEEGGGDKVSNKPRRTAGSRTALSRDLKEGCTRSSSRRAELRPANMVSSPETTSTLCFQLTVIWAPRTVSINTSQEVDALQLRHVGERHEMLEVDDASFERRDRVRYYFGTTCIVNAGGKLPLRFVW